MVRTRFAPSPTGLLHLGNARTALFCYLFAKQNKGAFVLRIEDTDQERLLEGSEKKILEDLRWLGLDWDEGPDVGGPLGPYRCSERYDIYKDFLKKTKAAAGVYRCFCTPERLEQDRKLLSSQGKPLTYVGRCRSISEEESDQRAQKEAFVWRMRVDENADPIKIKDVIRGEVKMAPNLIGDFVIFRSSGIPVFLFANAVDDGLMEMSHVIRGEDHLSNTFRQVLIYRALGFQEPIFVHLPMIGDSDGGKLSKRGGSLSIEALRESGYLPDALTNYLALLGWSPGDTAQTGEKFKKEELIKIFSLERVHKGRALFDPQKLDHLNGEHLRDLSDEELARLVPPRDKRFEDLWKDAIQLVRHEATTLNDLHKIETFLIAPDYTKSEVAKEVLANTQSQTALAKGLERFTVKRQEVEDVETALKTSIKEVGKELGIKGKALFFPFRIALTGTDAGPELIPLAKLLGVEEVQRRLEAAKEFAQKLSA